MIGTSMRLCLCALVLSLGYGRDASAQVRDTTKAPAPIKRAKSTVKKPKTASTTAPSSSSSPSSSRVLSPSSSSSPATKAVLPAATAKTPPRSSVPRDTTPRDPRFHYTAISYISGETIYLDAGTTAGLRERAVADVFRRDSIVAALEVQYVSSSRAAARLTRGSGLAVGDSVRFVPAVDAPVIATSATSAANSGGTNANASRDGSATTATAPRRRSGPPAVTGRVGLRYMSLQTGTGANGRITQPAVDFRLEGHRMNGSPFGLVIDARAHRQTSGSGQVDGSTRAYQSYLEYQTEGTLPLRVSLGRQIATVLSSLGYFDGLTVDADHENWRLGALAGTQPDYTNFMPSGAIREVGAWVQWHNAPGTGTIIQATLGGVGSYGATQVNREFALLTTMIVTPTVSVYATQEIDVNRGWRKDAEAGHSITPTSTFATARVGITKEIAIQGGYDSRRSVRLYRDFLTPDVAFDDALRRGYWGGVSVSAPHVYFSADARTSDGATVGRSQSNTAMLSFTRFTPLGLGLRARGTSYTGPTVSGALTSASLEANPFGRIRIEATLGKRNDRRAGVGLAPVSTTWVGVDADAGIGRSWYVMLSHYREVGATDRLLQQYAGLSWRF